MMAGIILLSVLAVLVFLTLFRVRLDIAYDGELTVKIRYLFIAVRMNGRESGKAKKRKKGAEKPETEQKPKPKPDAAQVIRLVRRYSGALKKAGGAVWRRLRIDRLFIRLIINEEDAAKTAILYGEASAVIYPAAAFLCSEVRVKNYEIDVRPRFDGGPVEAAFACVAGIRLCSMILIGVTALFRLLAATVRANKPANKLKDGAVQ